jgi:hypothetical protein
MTTQTTYSERMPATVAGFDPDMRGGDRITLSCETAAGIGFGLAVGRGVSDAAKGAVIGGALATFRGATVRDITQIVDGTNLDKYPQYAGMTVKVSGVLDVQVSGAPGPTDPVHYNATTGVFASSGGSGPIVGARWLKTSANGIGRVYLPAAGQVAG